MRVVTVLALDAILPGRDNVCFVFWHHQPDSPSNCMLAVGETTTNRSPPNVSPYAGAVRRTKVVNCLCESAYSSAGGAGAARCSACTMWSKLRVGYLSLTLPSALLVGHGRPGAARAPCGVIKG